MRQHYRFDYQKAKPNRFAGQFGKESMAVVPDLDVEGQALENDDMLSEYDFSGGVRGKHCAAYREGHAVEVHKADTTGDLESAEDDTR